MEVMKMFGKVKGYMDRMTPKEVGVVAAAVLTSLALIISLHAYQSKKEADFSLRLSKAENSSDYQAIINDGCPSGLEPVARFFLAKSLYEEGKVGDAEKLFEDIVVKHPSHWLEGRALVGYMHAGFDAEKSEAFLAKIEKIIMERTSPWKNEALYELGLLFEQASNKEKAIELFREVVNSQDPFWKQRAEFQIADLSRGK